MLRGLKFIPCLLAFLLSACGQWWQVRPYPDFVGAEIKPGDRVRIRTHDGERKELVVADVRGDRIVGENVTIMLNEIARLEKRSDTSPANPCSPQAPLGCSVPDWANVLHESQSHFKDYFYPSCEQHDFCYRHGARTYGMTRNACDYQFLQDMQAQCHPGNFEDFLQVSGNYTTCGAVALEFYMAVQKYGASHFKSSASTYCEYDGPP